MLQDFLGKDKVFIEKVTIDAPPHARTQLAPASWVQSLYAHHHPRQMCGTLLIPSPPPADVTPQTTRLGRKELCFHSGP